MQQVLYTQSNDQNTYSSLFSLLHCGRTSTSFRATSFSHEFQDMLKTHMDSTVNVNYDEKLEFNRGYKPLSDVPDVLY